MSDLKALLERADRAVADVPLPADGLEGLQRHRDRKRRNQRITAGVVGIAVFVAAVWIVTSVGSLDRSETSVVPGGDVTGPAETGPGTRVGTTAEEVATDFFNAYGVFHNPDQAVSMLANDADLSGLGVDETREFRLLIRTMEAAGFKVTLDSCVETISGTYASVVRCTYDFHALRSDEIGRGPYSGNYAEFTIRDGEIIDVLAPRNLEFLREMAEPFADWVSANYPDDVAVMYTPHFSDFRLSPESIRLWERRSREYAKAVKQGTA
jgi:hypothetical protein